MQHELSFGARLGRIVEKEEFAVRLLVELFLQCVGQCNWLSLVYFFCLFDILRRIVLETLTTYMFQSTIFLVCFAGVETLMSRKPRTLMSPCFNALFAPIGFTKNAFQRRF